MDAYVTLWTGSRDLTDRTAVYAKLDELDAAHPALRIRVGDCPDGLDAFVRKWSMFRWGVEWRQYCRVYAADWARWPRGVAGPKRNELMVSHGADEAHAWWAPPPAENKGTTGCWKLLKAAGIEVVEYGREPAPEQMELPL